MNIRSNEQKSNENVRLGPPPKQGLYDPQFEHDACGVGFVVNIKGQQVASASSPTRCRFW